MGWITDVAQLIAAAGIGSLVAQFFSRGGERRALRAKVREELGAVEEFRWAKDVDQAEAQRRNDELFYARRRLLSAAMMAGLPRELVEVYDHAAMAAYQSSKESLEQGREEATVPGAVSDCVREAYQLICDLLWRPVLARTTYRRRLRRLRVRIADARQTEEGQNLRWRYHEA